MTKQSSRPVLPRLHQPTLPNKLILKAQSLNNKTSAPPAAHSQPLRDSRQPDQCDETPRANLIPDVSSDDEEKVCQDLPSSNSSVSPLEIDNTMLQAGTGVYVDNVEILSVVHPLQCCCTEDETSPLKGCSVTRSIYGRPLSAAPILPTRNQAQSKPISFTTGTPQESSKRTMPITENDRIPNKRHRSSLSQTPIFSQAPQSLSREAQVKEASVMIEAAVALANLHESKASKSCSSTKTF
jgi:hypothetical protein